MARSTDRRIPTMEDIGRRAGVSASTVSRVINDSVAVDPATAERVRAAIAELGYRPNLLARSFRRRTTQTIGLLVPDNSNPFFAELARVIEDAGFAEGYNVILCNSDLSDVKQQKYVDVLLAKRVDGVIISSAGLVGVDNGAETVRRIQEANVPCVAIDWDLGDFPVDQVLVDNHEGGYLAGRHLMALGHRRMACVVGPSDLAPSAGRIAGFQQALDEAGLRVASDLLVQGNGRHDGGVTAARELLRRETDFTAVFAFNDEMAVGVIGALQRAGRRVPRDVSVIGFDDIPHASAMYPSVTTIAQPIAEMGRLGVQLLLTRLRQPDAPHERVVLSTTLVKRESSGAVAEPPHGTSDSDTREEDVA
ncbi:MAG TPA: LacI family DNA-binding transcriptional regulator [Thermomicrobiales bacterium]|nr:LacI family DNA-binding transcriptional regulator [Thermomicrobiales bacterium]